jgi:zinc transport system substrate-binding protein
VKTRIVLTLIAAATLAGCGGGTGSAATTVVAAFYPLAFAAQQIGGDGISVRNLTPPGVEPHDLELAGSDIRTIADAGLVLYLGQDFQPALEDAIDSTSANAVDLLGPGKAKDPHVWLDPIRYAALAERIGKELDRGSEAERLAAKLRALDSEFRRGLSHCERKEIVTSHAAFGYLAERFGLQQESISGLSPDAEPTPDRLAELKALVEQDGVTTIFTEELVSPKVAETLAQETGATTAVLNPLESLTPDEVSAGDDYASVMQQNLSELRTALGCR